jgi:hypothetical protein
MFQRQRTAEELRAALVGDEPAKPMQSGQPLPAVDEVAAAASDVACLRDLSAGGD